MFQSIKLWFKKRDAKKALKEELTEELRVLATLENNDVTLMILMRMYVSAVEILRAIYMHQGLSKKEIDKVIAKFECIDSKLKMAELLCGLDN